MSVSWNGARRACAIVPLSLALAAACSDGPTAEDALVASVARLEAVGTTDSRDVGTEWWPMPRALDSHSQGVDAVPLRWGVQQVAGAPATPERVRADSLTKSGGFASATFRMPDSPGTWRFVAVLGRGSDPAVPAAGDGVRTVVYTIVVEPKVAARLEFVEDDLWLQPGESRALTMRVFSTRMSLGASLPAALTWLAATPGVVDLTDSVTVRGLAYGATMLRAKSGTLSDSVRAYVLAPFAASQVSMGLTACAVVDGRGVHCWPTGSGSSFSHTPVPLAGGEALVSVSAGESHACGLEAGGRALCWGSNLSGELGASPTLPSGQTAPPTPVATALRFQQVRAASGAIQIVPRSSCGLALDGSVQCWGSNVHGAFGAAEPASSAVPVRVPLEVPIVELALGHSHACGRAADGALLCWGRNDSGQLGDADAANRLPRRVVTSLRFTHVVVGDGFTCGIADDARAHCWGANDRGQLGIGSEDASRVAPAPVAGGLSFVSLSAGAATVCGVTPAGAVHCWGSNAFSALGAPYTLTQSRVPLAVATAGPVAEVSVGRDSFVGAFSVCVRGVDGAVACWGAARALANPAETALCSSRNDPQAPPCRPRPLPALWLPGGRPVL